MNRGTLVRVMVKSTKRAVLDSNSGESTLPDIINTLLKISPANITEETFSPLLDALEKRLLENTTTESSACTDWAYVHTRLMKGSCSVKESVQKTFLLALTEVCKKFSPQNNLIQLMTILRATLTPESLYGTNNISRSQETSYFTGKLGCFKTLFETYAEQVNVLASDSRMLTIEECLQLAKKRPSLCILAYSVVLKLKPNSIETQNIIAKLEVVALNADLIWFFSELCPSGDEIPQKIVHLLPKLPLLSNTESILEILSDPSSQQHLLHPLWEGLMDYAMKASSIPVLLTAVDRNLVGSESVVKRCLGLQVLELALSKPAILPDLPNLIETIKHSKSIWSRGKSVKRRTDEPLLRIVRQY